MAKVLISIFVNPLVWPGGTETSTLMVARQEEVGGKVTRFEPTALPALEIPDAETTIDHPWVSPVVVPEATTVYINSQAFPNSRPLRLNVQDPESTLIDLATVVGVGVGGTRVGAGAGGGGGAAARLTVSVKVALLPALSRAETM